LVKMSQTHILVIFNGLWVFSFMAVVCFIKPA